MSAYRHLIGGCIGTVPHEPGDVVDPHTDKAKLEEWLAAGVIEPVTVKAPKKPKEKNPDE